MTAHAHTPASAATQAAIDALCVRFPNFRTAPQLVPTFEPAPAETGADVVSPNSILAYRTLLERHDWNYEWSDDSRRWHEGRCGWQELVRRQRRYDPDFVIWNELAPECCRRGESHKATTLAAMKVLIDAAERSLDYSPELRRAIADAHAAWAQASEVRHG